MKCILNKYCEAEANDADGTQVKYACPDLAAEPELVNPVEPTECED